MSFLQTFRQSTSCLRRNCLRYSSTAAAPAGEAQTKKKDEKPSGPAVVEVQSSCPPDTVLMGLNYLKGQPAVLALPDDQYPPWLWTILKPKEYADDAPGGRAERARRRNENKKRIKDTNFMKTQ